MRTKEEIEEKFQSSGRTNEGCPDRGSFYFFFDIVDNQELILEVLLDIRELLLKKK